MGTQVKITENSWKTKAIARGAESRGLRRALTLQKARTDKWRQAYYSLKSSMAVTQVKHHKYPLELIWIAVHMVINSNISLRGTSKTLSKIGELLGIKVNNISPSTIRNWCLRFGLYSLNEPIAKGKYVLISDESIEIGRERLLLLLVVPESSLNLEHPLKMEDVRVLDLAVQESWSAVEITARIQKKIDQYGLDLLYGISDKCSTLRKVHKSLNISWIGDCTHEIANQAKSLFSKDECFNGFIKSMNALRAKWIMSKHHLYVPPTLRSKSRFHQLFILHRWGQKILDNWDQIPLAARQELHFVKEAKSLIRLIGGFHSLIEQFSVIFKAKGITKKSLKQWRKQVKAYRRDNQDNWTHQEERFLVAMDKYLQDQQQKQPDLERILCCSDIIESMFGKYKNKAGVKMITDDALKIVAFPKRKSMSQVKQALEEVKTANLYEWKKKNTTVSKLAILKRDRLKSAA